jgi:hypothetical protein
VKRSVADLVAERSEAKSNPAKHNHQAPAGYRLRGVSTLLGADGEVKQTWVKTAPDTLSPDALLAEFRAAIEGADIAARAPLAAPRHMSVADLLSVYAWGDPHIGMLAWHLECGEDFDLGIAEDLMFGAVDKLVSLAPPSEEAVLVSPGDFYHMDNQFNRTTTGTHQLDVDSRLGKVFRVGMSVSTRSIDRSLEKHKRVTVLFVPGNHDGTLSLLLPMMLAYYYRNEPRVTIDTSPSPFMKYRFGKCLLATTHSDKVKLGDLAEVMACDWPKDWGDTEFRHWYVGHLHHRIVKEMRGCTVEVLPTLAAKDSYHHAHGYRALRSMKLDVWHREYGLQCTNVVGIKELRP